MIINSCKFQVHNRCNACMVGRLIMEMLSTKVCLWSEFGKTMEKLKILRVLFEGFGM